MIKNTLTAAALAVACGTVALAQDVSALGTTLTAFGAEKAGSADGAIPPYTGGIAAMTGLPAGSPETGYPDPFASEAPVFTVTAANMAQYADELTPGEQALLQRFPDFRMDVYPTHRTESYPAWVLADTLKNATSAAMVGDGDGVTGAYGGIPFPIPKDGNEVMWNSFLQYHAAFCTETSQNYLMDSSGSVTDLGTLVTNFVEPYYNPAATSLPGKFWRYFTVDYHTPESEAGQLFMFQYPMDFTQSDDVTYFYSPGTRRVRLAPEFKYDTPIAAYGGAIDYDEIQMFYGRMDKFDFHLVGKKEMIVPYNDYKIGLTTESALLGPHTVNPDDVRWERHRVWIVDATLKPGQRHIFSHWTFYIDEDSWEIVASQSYDHAGAIYRVGFSYPYQTYAGNSAVDFSRSFGYYDFSKGNYEISFAQTGDSGFYRCDVNLPNMSLFTPQSMAAQSLR